MIREALTPSRLAHLAGWGNSAGVFYVRYQTDSNSYAGITERMGGIA